MPLDLLVQLEQMAQMVRRVPLAQSVPLALQGLQALMVPLALSVHQVQLDQ